MNILRQLLKILIAFALICGHSTWADDNMNIEEDFFYDEEIVPGSITIDPTNRPDENTPIRLPIGLDWLENFLTENNLMNANFQEQLDSLRNLINQAFGWIRFDQGREELWSTTDENGNTAPCPNVTVYTQVARELEREQLNDLRAEILKTIGTQAGFNNSQNLLEEIKLVYNDPSTTNQQRSQIGIATMILTRLRIDLKTYFQLIEPDENGDIPLLRFAQTRNVEDIFFDMLHNTLLELFDPTDVPEDYRILFVDNEPVSEEEIIIYSIHEDSNGCSACGSIN